MNYKTLLLLFASLIFSIASYNWWNQYQIKNHCLKSDEINFSYSISMNGFGEYNIDSIKVIALKDEIIVDNYTFKIGHSYDINGNISKDTKWISTGNVNLDKRYTYAFHLNSNEKPYILSDITKELFGGGTNGFGQFHYCGLTSYKIDSIEYKSMGSIEFNKR